MKRSKRLFLLVKLLISTSLAWVVYHRIPSTDLKTALAQLDLRPLALVFVLLFCNTLISAWKWQILLRADGIHVPLKRLFVSYLVGTFCNIFLPSNIGGDAYRIYDVSRLSANPASSLASVFADRLSGFVAVAVLALVSSFGVWHLTGSLVPTLVATALLGALGVVTWALARQTPVQSFLHRTRLARYPKVTHFSEQCLASFSAYRKRGSVLVRIMGISFLFQFSVIVCVALMAASLNLGAPFLYFCAFVPLITFAEAIPLSIYGVGIRDAAYVGLFGLAGISNVEALPLLYLAMTVGYSLIGGVVLLFKRATPEAASVEPPSNRNAPTSRTLLLSVIATLLVWATFSWPLPRHVTKGIPASAHNVEKHHARSMIAGDHLQLLYHFWLADDMLAGQTPWFKNLYEFNTGPEDEAQRYEPGTYYFPFSFIASVIAWIGGNAVGWNASHMVSLFLSVWLSLCLVRRYARSTAVCLVAALVGATLPFRWITLLGGSPTGFAIGLVPLLLLGIDYAVRDERPLGGWLAGVAVLLAFASDLHVFFFSVLMIPAWCIVAFATRERFAWRESRAYLRLVWALFPLVALTAIAYGLSRATANQLATSHMQGGWTWLELSRYSPASSGVFSPALGISAHVYLGFLVPALVLAGILAAFYGYLQKRDGAGRTLLLLVFLVGGIAGMVMLALGTHGPAGGLAIHAARKLVPPYRMVRQTAKVFCLMPSVLAVATALSLTWLFRNGDNPATEKPGKHRACTLGIVVVGLLIMGNYKHRIDPTICLLDNTQGAYEAVAESAHNMPPRAIVLPIWPGDSHWSSLYQHYASLYRMRLINGYSPVVQDHYFIDSFKRFESMNVGVVTDAQLDDLQQRDIHHILLHEDAFPEKVSPFPVCFTLEQLLNHPRLDLLKQDQSVWAFSIRKTGKPRRIPTTQGILFPSLRWELERHATSATQVVQDPRASGGAFFLFTAGDNHPRLAPRAPIPNAPGLRWTVRCRGRGSLVAVITADGRELHRQTVITPGKAWTWIDIPVPPTAPAFLLPELTLTHERGTLQADVAALVAGAWPLPGDAAELQAWRCFHAGFSNPSDGSVFLRKEKETNSEVVYARIRLKPGGLTVTMKFQAHAPPGTRLGSLVLLGAGNIIAETPVLQGKTAILRPTLKTAGIFVLEFRYSRKADMQITSFGLANPTHHR